MAKVHFDFEICPDVVRSDREQFRIQTLDKMGLRQITKGKIVITAEEPRQVIVVESEVLDYAEQLKGVVVQIDSGQFETFAVSGDYFSNNLRFTYEPFEKTLEIYEMNGGEFKVITPYQGFRVGVIAFYRRLLSDLQSLYPELTLNKEFLAMR